MNNISYTKIFSKNWDVIALLAGIAIVISLVFSILQPFQFRASTKLLVIQDQLANLDTFTATKSAEKVGKNLTQVVGTSVFYNEVFNLNPTLESLFPSDTLEKRKEWNENVQVAIIPDTGILSIEAYDVNKVKSAELVQAIAAVLVSQADEFHGAGDQIKVKVIDDVFISRYPVRPNVILNTLFAAVLGVMIGCAFTVLREARRIKLSQRSLFDLQAEPQTDLQTQPSFSELAHAYNEVHPAESKPVFRAIVDQPRETEPATEKLSALASNPVESIHNWKIIEENN